jgi:hypothetical protein
MTEFVYPAPLETFGVPGEPEQFGEVDVLGGGTPALQAASDELGLAFDAADLEVSAATLFPPSAHHASYLPHTRLASLPP